MVFPIGIEPTAFPLGGERSILLSYGNIKCFWSDVGTVDGLVSLASSLHPLRKHEIVIVFFHRYRKLKLFFIVYGND